MNRATARVDEASMENVTFEQGAPTLGAQRLTEGLMDGIEPAGRTPALSTTDCEKLLQIAVELYTVRELANLPQHLLRALRAIVPHEFGGCHLLEPSRHHIAAFYEPALSPLPTLHKDFWRLTETHPLNPLLFANPARAWKLSDVISRRAFHNTEFYDALYRPLDMDCELVAVLPDSQSAGTFLLLSLHRRRDDFSERDRTILNLLLPHVAEARQQLRLNRERSAARTGGM